MTVIGDAVGVLAALGLYQGRILPRARRELRRWEALAQTIPAPALRRAALSSLREKGRNVEATAVFAILAPRGGRAGALRAMAALQVAVDYLDALGEQAQDRLASGLALHEALVDALSPGAPPSDWYRLHSQAEDGGYLAALVRACRDAVAVLPSQATVLPLARRAAGRCGEGQSYTHAAAGGSASELRRWAGEQANAPGYEWWEVAAGASSSVAAHALIAAAADPRTTAAEAALIDAAYYPPIGALTVLLDDLIDREEDLAAGEHNYIGHYASNRQAADRLAFVAGRARAATARLRHARRHRAILTGVAGFYLSAEAAGGGYARPIRERMLESLDPTVRPILAAMRLRRRG